MLVLSSAALTACSGSPEPPPFFTVMPAAGETGGSHAGAGGAAGTISGAGGDASQAGAGGSSEPIEPATAGVGGVGGAGGGSVEPLPIFTELVGTDEGRNDVAGGEVCERIATIQCAAEVSCCDAPGRTFEACKSTMKEGCVENLFLDAITGDAKAGYDRERAKATFAEFERLAGLCDLHVAEFGVSSEGFAGLARGTLAMGASCQVPLEDLGLPRRAAPFLFACSSPETHACLPRLDSEWLCTARAPEGGACFTDVNCTEGLFCTNSKARSLTGGTCNARKADGASCDYPSDCRSLSCSDSACVPATQHNLFCLDDE